MGDRQTVHHQPVELNMRNKVIALLDSLGNPYQMIANCLIVDYALSQDRVTEILRICGHSLTASVEKNTYFERTIFGAAEDLMRLYSSSEFHEIRRRKWKSIIDQCNPLVPHYYESLPKDMRYWLETGFHPANAMAIFNLTVANSIEGFADQSAASQPLYPTSLFEFNHCSLVITNIPSVQDQFGYLGQLSKGWKYFTDNYEYFTRQIREIGDRYQGRLYDSRLDISALEAEYSIKLKSALES